MPAVIIFTFITFGVITIFGKYGKNNFNHIWLGQAQFVLGLLDIVFDIFLHWHLVRDVLFLQALNHHQHYAQQAADERIRNQYLQSEANKIRVGVVCLIKMHWVGV